MEKTKGHRILSVLPGSIASELELEAGDCLLSIDGKEVGDILDYRYLMNEEYLTVEVLKKNGEIWELEIEKEYEEDIGLEFENGLMDRYRTCQNRCIFCFIDQMPKGMRRTLYFKDDDARLSFLQGNYVTLTNLSEHDVERIIRYRLSPINISFQTMNPDLRVRMLRNRFAGEALSKAERFFEAGITMNGQIVLCRGYNDGAELEYSISELSRYAPVLQSLSIVPVGLSKYREGLTPLSPFTREEAKEVIESVRRWQRILFEKTGLHFVHASDEWYLLAGEPLPKEEDYDGYLQLENGVGMLRLLLTESEEALSLLKGDERRRTLTVATGLLAAPTIEGIARKVQSLYPGIQIFVIPVVNRFFGEQITVSGLLTGRDLIEQLAGRPLGDALLLPVNMLREGEEVFLDDLTVSELSKALRVPVRIVGSSGEELIRAFLDPERKSQYKRRQIYEQTSSSDCGQAECRQIRPL